VFWIINCHKEAQEINHRLSQIFTDFFSHRGHRDKERIRESGYQVAGYQAAGYQAAERQVNRVSGKGGLCGKFWRCK
jgi:hypothetical protein